MKIKKGDKVLVIAGNYKGETGEVLSVLRKKNKVVVENVNVVKKHVKPSQQNPEGQIIEFAAPIHVSNVMLFDEKAKTGTRVGYKLESGKKVRFSKKSQTNLDK